MTFLAPAFLLGLSAIAIPIIIHLIQRERRRVVQFPSLMFLRRIPYQSVRRRRIRNWALLAMRAGAVLLMVTAFARPFFRREALATGAAGGAREVVILLDQSASMGYGDHWQRAQAAARRVANGLSGDDRGTLVLFATSAEENVRATSDRVRLAAAIDAARVGSGATRFGPALKLAQSILSRSPLRRREAVLVSDFQKSGWTGSEDVHFPEGTQLTPVSVASADATNVSVPSTTFARATFSGQERVTVAAGVTNRGSAAVTNLLVTLEIDGRVIETEPVSVAPNSSASVSFAPFTLADSNVKGTVKAGSDALPQDNVFHFVLTPGRPVSIALVDSRPGASLYLSRALSIGSRGGGAPGPTFQVDSVPPAQITPTLLEKHAVLVLNDAPFPSSLGNGVLNRFVQRGGGLLVILGEHSTWPVDDASVLPGRLGAAVDPAGGRSASIGFIDYSHPVFELFKAPRSGDFSGTRVFRYRSLEPASPETDAPDVDARVLARFDDGAVAAAEKRIGTGRVIVWSSTLDDSWNDLALKPVFLPLVHQTFRYLAQYQEPAAWYTVGQALDVTEHGNTRAERIALTPSGQRVPLTGPGAPRFIELSEQGFYEIRTTGSKAPRPDAIAVNLDPAESDLSVMDPRELVAAATGHAGPNVAAAKPDAAATPEETERRQSLWWYLLLAGALLLAGETALSNRISWAGSGV